MTARRAFVALLASAVLLSPGAARAGNGFTFPAGSRAAGMAGAYAALADDPGSAWWNPAGLGWISRSSLDVSATAYHLQMLRIPEIIRTTLPSGTRSADFSANPFQVVASSLTFVWKFGDWEKEVAPAPEPRPATSEGPPRDSRHALAFSVFVPVSSKFSQSASLDSQELAGPFHQRFSLSSQDVAYFIGPSWGMRLGRHFSVGASLFGVYATGEARAAFTVDQQMVPPGDTQPRQIFSTFNADVSSTQLGLAVHLGAQARISGFRAGLVLRLPTLRVWGRTRGTTLQTASVDADGALDPTFDDRPLDEGSGAGFATPFSMTVGLAWQQPGRFAISLDADYTTAWNRAGTRTRNHFNGRLGVEAFLSPSWILDFGGFTDVSPSPRFGTAGNETFVDLRMDWFGGTVAVTYLSPYLVVGSDRTDRITFTYTVGLKYAYGSGRIVGMDIDYTGGPGGNALKPVTSHELSLIVATGVRF